MPAEAPASPAQVAAQILPLDFAPNDPLSAYLLSAGGPVDLERLKLDSPALDALREAGVRLIAPLAGQGELIGLLNLGPRRSEQEYTADDRKLLGDLATQAAPAVRVAQLVRQQQIEAQARERLEQELRVARVVQQTLLPKELPELAGWQVAAYWQPAQAVSGDFYDFINLPDGNLGIVEADVTGKGVPAALVMASARGILRVAAEQDPASPGKVLAHVNELLCPDIPPSMFVTCLYGVLNPSTGRFIFANAGHNLPAKCTVEAVVELRATGMPLGLLPEMTYDEHETILAPGESLLIYSDGLVEAHNPQGEMFGFPRLRILACGLGSGAELIEHLRGALADFTGPGWEQEDDVTFVTLERNWAANQRSGESANRRTPATAPERNAGASDGESANDATRNTQHAMPTTSLLAEFTIPERAGQRTRGDGASVRGSGWARPAGRSAGAAQDRRGGGDDERHGARQPLRSRPAGRHPGANDRRRVDRRHHRSRRRPADPGSRCARPGSQAGGAAIAARLGALPHPQHGGRTARDRRWRPSYRRAGDEVSRPRRQIVFVQAISGRKALE